MGLIHAFVQCKDRIHANAWIREKKKKKEERNQEPPIMHKLCVWNSPRVIFKKDVRSREVGLVQPRANNVLIQQNQALNFKILSYCITLFKVSLSS